MAYANPEFGLEEDDDEEVKFLEDSTATTTTSSGMTFESLINTQHTNGFWPSAAKLNLSAFLRDGQTEDSEVREALAQETLTEELEVVYTTLVAIFILQEKYEDRADEWALLARKAKSFLREAGLAKPDKLIRLFSEIEAIN